MKSIITLLLFSWLGIALAACNTGTINTPGSMQEPSSTYVKASPTLQLTETPVPPPPTSTTNPPTATAFSLPPTETPMSACVLINYGEYAQVEIIAPSEQQILIDIYDPSKLTNPVTENDILLTTHIHWDHVNEDFQTTFPGKQLYAETGMLEAPGIHIQGIASAHNEGDRHKPSSGSNYIYRMDISNLRIVHFGDIGQKTLSEEQIADLGAVDIAITQINNPYSDMNAENRKGIQLMEQLQSRLVIPTHLNLDTVKLALAQWEGYYAETSNLEVCDSDLSQEGTQFLLIGEAVETMTNYVDLVLWGDP
ncbi:MBL fold metallo-hydrolase [Chloroflexota bacterium]